MNRKGWAHDCQEGEEEIQNGRGSPTRRTTKGRIKGGANGEPESNAAQSVLERMVWGGRDDKTTGQGKEGKLAHGGVESR